MQNTRFLKKMKYLLLGFCGVSILLTTGCATDIEFLAKVPGFEARSDKIPGLTPPLERKKAIRHKGEMGAKASEAEKDLLVSQLIVEYRTSPDPNMRRESVDAMAKIEHPKRDRYMKEILKDSDPFIRISALEAIGQSYDGSEQERADILIEHLKRDPDKDVRLVSTRLLGTVGKLKIEKRSLDDMRQTINLALGDALLDKVPAVRYEAMKSLAQTTGKDYGADIDRWLQHVQYIKGETRELPQERTFAEKLPTIHLPMFK